MRNQIKFDYSKLRGRIVEKFGKINKFAEAMNLPVSTISLYLNNHYPWKQYDIVTAAKILDISTNDIPAYFFVLLVQ